MKGKNKMMTLNEYINRNVSRFAYQLTEKELEDFGLFLSTAGSIREVGDLTVRFLSPLNLSCRSIAREAADLQCDFNPYAGISRDELFTLYAEYTDQKDFSVILSDLFCLSEESEEHRAAANRLIRRIQITSGDVTPKHML